MPQKWSWQIHETEAQAKDQLKTKMKNKIQQKSVCFTDKLQTETKRKRIHIVRFWCKNKRKIGQVQLE